MASLASQTLRVEGGRASPWLSMAMPPTSAGVYASEKPNFRWTASSTLMASAITSGPMPSPANRAIVWVMGVLLQTERFRAVVG